MFVFGGIGPARLCPATVHQCRVDDLDRRIGTFWLSLARIYQRDWHRRQGCRRGHRSGSQIGERGDCDVVFVHDKPAELAFVDRGFGIDRQDVMYNDFILVGPAGDPAHVGGGDDIVAALREIAGAKAPFVARGDDSGTSKAELRLWEEAGIDPKTAAGGWYKDTGSGMGPTLNTAAAMGGYTLSDRGTWLNFKNRQDLKIVVQGDRRLFNQYGVMLVNPARHPHVKQELSHRFIDWLLSSSGQKIIADYKINGEQLFFPNADYKRL